METLCCNICGKVKLRREFYIKRGCCRACVEKERYWKNIDETRLRRRERFKEKMEKDPFFRARRSAYRNADKQKMYRRVNRKKYRNDPAYKILNALRRRIHKVLHGAEKSVGTLELLGCSVIQFRDYIQQRFQPGMSWNNHGEWHIDHITPCAVFNLTDPAQQRQCFHYTNLQPLWAFDNISKGAKLL